MLEPNWLAEQLNTNRQNRLMEFARKERQAQEACQPRPTRQPRRLVAKLRAEMTDLTLLAQAVSAQVR